MTIDTAIPLSRQQVSKQPKNIKQIETEKLQGVKKIKQKKREERKERNLKWLYIITIRQLTKSLLKVIYQLPQGMIENHEDCN